MLDHVGLAVRDVARSRAFYKQALAPLGYRVLGAVPPEETASGGAAGDHGMGTVGWKGRGAPFIQSSRRNWPRSSRGEWQSAQSPTCSTR